MEYLLKNRKFVTVEELAETLHVSTRTIRADLAKVELYLNSCNVSLYKERGLGIAIRQEDIGKNLYEKLLKELKKEMTYYSDEERYHMILQKLLLSEENITIQELAEDIQAGRTTTIKDLRKCEEWLERNHLSLVKRPRHGMYISYREEDWRRAVINYINKNLQGFDFQNIYNYISNGTFFFMNMAVNDFINELIGEVSFVSVKNLIRKFESDFLVRFTDEGFVNIFFYICISWKRVKIGKLLKAEQVQDMPSIGDISLVVGWLKDNYKVISPDMKRIFLQTEFNYLAYYVLSQNKLFSKEKNEANPDINWLTREYIDEVETSLGIELSEDETLFENLAMHLEITINRLLFGIQIENPFMTEIRETYPQVYKACMDAGALFERCFHKRCSEDEISYLAMHVAVAVERTKEKKNSVRVLKAIIVCSSGVGTSNMIKARIINELPNIDVFKVCSVDELSDTDISQIDLIITTTPLIGKISKPILYVSPFLQEKDINLLKKYIYKAGIALKDNSSAIVEDIMTIILQECVVKDYVRLYEKINAYFKLEKGKKKESILLSDLAIPEHIRLQADIKNCTEAIRVGSTLLYRTGCVKKDYTEELFKAKEIMGPNIVIAPGIALVHTKPSPKVSRLSMSFLVLKTPVAFGNEECDPVKLVLTLAAMDNSSHLELLSELIELIEEEETLSRLYVLKDMDEFRNTLLEFESEHCR